MLTDRIEGSFMIRPLFIDFNAYTDGDDNLKKELAISMIENLLELQQVAEIASKCNDSGQFHKVCHKISTTLLMLEDTELLQAVEQLKITLTVPYWVAVLDKLCTDIIESLRRE